MVSKYLSALRNLPTLIDYAVSGTKKRSDAEALRAAAEWLLVAQQAGAGGYAHSYHLARGWQAAYPETTGYIIPTMMRTAEILGEPAYLTSAERALSWLLGIQQPDGSFLDLAGKKQVFDVGQILIGLNYAYENGYEAKDSLIAASNWLCSVQEADGSFVTRAYHQRPHAYYSRVGAAMVQAGILTGQDPVRDAGLKQLGWVMAQQLENGFFRHLSFAGEPPFLHTMVYVMEGLLDAYDLTGDDSYRQAAARFAEKLLALGHLPHSQYREDFSVANSEYCLTGLAQWAGICLRLADGRKDFWQAAEQALSFVTEAQLSSRNSTLDGAIPGSKPVQGAYLRYAFPNWAAKFFMDSLIMKINHGRSF